MTLTNTGAKALSIHSIIVSGNFQMSETCGRSVLGGASCDISATFTPKVGGGQQGLITLVDSASPKPQVIPLSGTGTVANLSPAQLNFSGQKVGTKSAPMQVTVTNEGNTSLTVSKIYIGGPHSISKDFSESDNCVARALRPAATCTINVTFSPTKTGTRSATLYVYDNGGGQWQPVSLVGTGS